MSLLINMIRSRSVSDPEVGGSNSSKVIEFSIVYDI